MIFAFCMLLMQSSIATAQQAEKPSRVVDFQRDIAPILKENCLTCHQGDQAKNGFLVMDQSAMMGYIEPGNASNSALWTDYLTQPSRDKVADSLVMPPDGPLKATELALLKLWIDEGANWEEAKPALDMPTIAQNWPMKIYRAIGYFHPAIVHFPIVLYMLSGLIAFLSYFLGARCRSTAFQCLVLAALSSVVAVIMGWSFADLRSYPAWTTPYDAAATHDAQNFFLHRWLGTSCAAIGLLTVFIGLLSSRYKSNALGHFWRLSAMVLALLVAAVGHQGGELVYGDIFEKSRQQLMP
jgi:uncharacterized membrane protein